MAEIGDVRMLYTIDPCGTDGRPINGGNHYADADTAEDARATAEGMLGGDGVYLGYTLGSVDVYGREMCLGWQAWEPVKGGRSVSFVVTRAEVGLPPVPVVRGQDHCWDTTVMDYPERVHAMLTDGSCVCGDPTAGYGGSRG